MHVGIVGAGISGLYAGLLLRRESHQVTIYERTNRVGGRIFTHHFTSPEASKDAYFESGAMRIPGSRLHSRVFDLIGYLNETCAKNNRIRLIPYELLGHDQAFFNGRKRSRSDHKWTSEAGLPFYFRGKSAEELLQDVVRPWVELLREDFDSGFMHLLRYDELSFRDYLREHAKWPPEVIDYVELFCSQTNQYHLSFTDIIIQCVDFGTKSVSRQLVLKTYVLTFIVDNNRGRHVSLARTSSFAHWFSQHFPGRRSHRYRPLEGGWSRATREKPLWSSRGCIR